MRHRQAPSQPRRQRGAVDRWLLLIVVGLLLAWRLADVLLLAFAGGLLALVLHEFSAPLQRRLKLPPRLALLLVVGLIVLVLGGGSWLAGSAAADQVQALRDTLPKAVQAARQWLGGHAPGRWLLELWQSVIGAQGDLTRIAGLATGTLNAAIGVLGSVVLLIALGIYLAADPQTYRRGFLALVPPPHRPRAEAVLRAVGHDLARWLRGQAVAMLFTGALTAAGLWLIGMPLALALGIVAGLVEFVPYFGPLLSGALIVAVALTANEHLALQAVLVCFAVQQAEAYVVQPLAQRWAVSLPPVLGMLSVLIFGLLFGLAGVLLAVPLMVLTMTLVQQLYVVPMAGGAKI